MLDWDQLICSRASDIDVSGIRRVFQLGAKLERPYNFSIGQPDFPVPAQLKQAAIEAIEHDHNGYTLTRGVADLNAAIAAHLKADVGWTAGDGTTEAMATSGTSGALLLAFMALLGPGDEAIIGDPWFVVYPALGTMTGATIVPCDTYPDCRLTAERVAPLITERTKIVLLNSPGNPSGAVLTEQEVDDLAALCRERGVLLISDEIYDVFTYSESCDEQGRCPSPARSCRDMLLVRGFGKTYGCTGWRMGWCAGPPRLIDEMAKLQQYTFVCAPSMAQHAMAGAFDLDMRPLVDRFQARRDVVLEALGDVAEIEPPGGAFYAFVRVPEALGMTATEFSERAVEDNVLLIPGAVFSSRDTHFRLSFAIHDQMLHEGLGVLRDLLAGGALRAPQRHTAAR